MRAHSHVHKGETSWKTNPTTSTAIGHLDCFHNFPLKYYFSRKRLTEMLSFCFYPRKFSVLFPSNKYQIKAHFPFFHLFQNGLRCFLLCMMHMCPCCLEFHSEGGGWEIAAGGGAWPRWATQPPLLPLQTVFWAPAAGPHAVASCCDVVHIRNKNND